MAKLKDYEVYWHAYGSVTIRARNGGEAREMFEDIAHKEWIDSLVGCEISQVLNDDGRECSDETERDDDDE